MARPKPDERPVTTSIALGQSKLDGYAAAALELKFSSRNALIAKVLTDWLIRYQARRKIKG